MMIDKTTRIKVIVVTRGDADEMCLYMRRDVDS